MEIHTSAYILKHTQKHRKRIKDTHRQAHRCICMLILSHEHWIMESSHTDSFSLYCDKMPELVETMHTLTHKQQKPQHIMYTVRTQNACTLQSRATTTPSL